jgi:glycosyltransferase involved in cell wall biosynthesis
MEKENYLLTVAIPTYNRASILARTLCILKPQIQATADHVEFIISDNCSDDNTEEVVRHHIDNGLKIKYVKNNTNIGALLNLFRCCKLAQGKYVWILGDDDFLCEDTIKFILELLKSGKDYGLLFYPKMSEGPLNYVEYNNSEEAFSNLTPLIGWISCNIVSKKAINNFDFDKYSDTYNAPSIINFDAVVGSQFNIKINGNFYASSRVALSTNVNYIYFKTTIEDIFTANEYRLKLKLKRKSCENYKRIMFDCITPNIYEFLNPKVKDAHYKFTYTNAWRYLLKCFWNSPYFYLVIIKILFQVKFSFIIKMIRRMSYLFYPGRYVYQKIYQMTSYDPLAEKKSLWRLYNPHNETMQITDFDHKKVFVGLKTKGCLIIHDSPLSKVTLTVGDNCSIGANVRFILNSKDMEQAGIKGNIKLNNNISIGEDVIIFPGVNIGNNAVIYPGSVVADDIPENSIVVGNPAKSYKNIEWILKRYESI